MLSSAYKKTLRPASNIALAVALMCGAAVGITAFADTAHARKRNKDKAPKANYSKDFIAVYQVVEALSKEATPDFAAIKAKVPDLIAAIETPDDKMAGGGLVYNTGIAATDVGLQRQGLDMMIDSGKLTPEQLPKYLVISGQLAGNDGQYTAARARYQQAIEAGYSGEAELGGVIAESYFKEEKYTEGLAYLKTVFDDKTASGSVADQNWYKRAVAVAFTNDLSREAVQFSAKYASAYPSTESWGDAIAIQRTFFDYDNNAMLDLLRLSDRTDSLRNARDYADYIEAADARRLPGEVKRVVEQGLAKGILESSDPFVVEAGSIANDRIDADLTDLPALERDARAAGSTAMTATSAGDAFLSYGMSAKAEEMYLSALGKSGVDMARVLTRLGIAQADQGKTAEAQANLAKVEGIRAPIAELWIIYAGQNAAPAAVPSAPAAPAMAEDTSL